MKPEIGKEYKTSDGYTVTFIMPIEQDGMYNVFRHDELNDYRAYYTDEQYQTPCGNFVILD